MQAILSVRVASCVARRQMKADDPTPAELAGKESHRAQAREIGSSAVRSADEPLER
jgi:hypothetical protein